MSIQVQILIVGFALLLLGFIFELLRRKKLNEAMTLWWVFIIILMIFLTLNSFLAIKIRELLGAALPSSVLLLFSLSFILAMLVYFSMKISVLSNQIKDIAEDIAIFKADFDQKKADK
ncbi:MAG: DUF2304 domain-containing protein [Candidatus Margulisiibacteriota bacterium]